MTLIELYDERPIENVLSSEVFRPERLVFLCEKQTAQNKNIKDTIKKYIRHRGLDCQIVFIESSMYDSAKIAQQVRHIYSEYPDSVVDITGGTDAELYACGSVCSELSIPVFTYSRKANRFYNIHNASFADDLPCTVQHRIEDCFMMTGGSLKNGRVNNAVLHKYAQKFNDFFRIYLSYRSEWTKAVSYFQSASPNLTGASSLSVCTGHSVKGDRGKTISAPIGILRELEKIGFVKKLTISEDIVSFQFTDAQIRNWLRDVGSVLELFVYQRCLDSGLFNDVRTSAVVNWNGSETRDAVSNEIDVMAMHGILPFFISCKTCAVTTEAINELAILRDRFGGKGAKAVIVSTQRCRNVTFKRASELDIDIIDYDDIKNAKLIERISSVLVSDR